MSVNMATSSTLLAAPTTTSDTSATASSGHGARSTIGIPQNTSADGSDQAPDADRRSHIADCPGSCVEHAEGRDDDQNVQAAADEGLREHEPDDEARLRPAGDLAKATEQQSKRALTSRRRHANAPFDPHPHQEHGRDEERHSSDCKCEPHVHERHEHAGHERSDQRAKALQRRGCAVGGNQLFRRSGQRGQQCLQRRPKQGGGQPDDGGERKDQDHASGKKGNRRSG
jgi:hypothetical protein